MRLIAITLLTLIFGSLYSEPENNGLVHIQLNSPVYHDGVLKTDQGGVLEGNKIRIQAQNIYYVKKQANQTENTENEWYVIAEGNLFIRYNGHPFVGEKLEYNFEKSEGRLINGRTQLGCWFVSSHQIDLLPDNSYKLYKTSLTTCESGNSLWEIHIKKGRVHEYDIISATNAQVRVLKVPIFWFPYLKTRFSTLKDLPAYYSFTTGGSQGQRISLRYLAYSSLTMKSYLQLDFWFKKGPSGSAQFDYKSPKGFTTLQSNSFLAYDKQGSHPPTGASPYNMFRQRYVGEFKSRVANKLLIHGQYEYLSDPYILETYFNRYYFLHTMRDTSFEMRINEKVWQSYLRAKVRINRFQTVNQELPIFHFNLKPLPIGNTGLITDASFNIGYLDYVFGSFISNQFTNFRSPRLEIKPRLYLPLHFWGLSITPFGQYIGVGYGQSPRSRPEWNTLGIVGAEANYKLSRIFNNKLRHTIEPYTSYQFMTKPTVNLNNLYFFDFSDAYAKNNQLRWGIRNSLYTKKDGKLKNPFNIDIYTYGFFNNSTIGSFIPRMYVEISTLLPFAFTTFSYAYNFQHNRIDFANVRTAITLSEDFAISFLFMHRSAYDYKKADHDSFLLDVFRPQSQLINSPLSDRRNIAQSKIYWRMLRNLIFEFESRQGWLRINSPPFNEMRFDVTFLLPCNWRFKFSPQRTISPNPGSKYIWRWHFSLQLGGNPPKEMSKPYIFW